MGLEGHGKLSKKKKESLMIELLPVILGKAVRQGRDIRPVLKRGKRRLKVVM